VAPTVSDKDVPRTLPDGAVLTQVPEQFQPLLDDLFAAVEQYNPQPDRELITRAFAAACILHGTQNRKSGEAYIHHPVGTALNCAELKLDSVTIAAALLHDVVEDTGTPVSWLEEEFGTEIAMLVDGVTKLTKMSFNSQEEEQAENYRKMIVAMATDIRVILIKLADRLHNMRTLCYLGKQKQIQKAKETLEIYAPLAHRLGIYNMKWQLEDLAFAALHPRKYAEIQMWVSQRRADREDYVSEAAGFLGDELGKAGLVAEITGRAKHFYSIYVKMSRGGKEFNEIFDLTALRVLVETVKDCYGAIGIIHSLWKPIPGRFKDYIAMPKFNMYQSLHTTVIGPGGKPLEIQIRTFDMHQTAEFGVAAHWMYKEKGDKPTDKLAWLRQMMEWQSETGDPREFMDTLRIDLFEDEVFVFTPKGDVKSLAAGSTPIDFAYAVHTDVGTHTVGAKVNGRIVPLHHTLRSGDIVEIITSKSSRGPSRDWLGVVVTPRAKQKVRQFFRREQREDSEHSGRDLLQEMLRREGLPAQKILSAKVFQQIVKEVGFQKVDDLYVALGSGRMAARTVVNKILQRAGTMKEAVPQVDMLPTEPAIASQTAAASGEFGIAVEGMSDIVVRMAKCCKPIPGDDIVGYISLGKGVTIHRRDCKNARALMRSPERFTNVTWQGLGGMAFRVEIQIEALDRSHLLEDVARTLSDSGANIITGNVQTLPDGVVRDRFTIEVGDVRQLDNIIANIRGIGTVYDAYRVVAS
jgi:GTP diphosphokinase / guanosine-3',5'-bis(diphosphate) 3'-diphosphatase